MPNRYAAVSKEILYWLFVAGVVVVAATSPYFLFNLLKRMGKQYPTRAEEKKKIADAFYRLKKSRLLILQEKKDGTFVVELSQTGKRKVKEMHIETLRLQRPKKWDRIWRFVIFDIPNKKKPLREALRQRLKTLGFYQLQESVWVCPWPCKEEIEFVQELLGTHEYVNFVEAKAIQNDVKLKAHFKLL